MANVHRPNLIPTPLLVPKHALSGSVRIYRKGYRYRQNYEKDEEKYVLSRILNQEDYSGHSPPQTARQSFNRTVHHNNLHKNTEIGYMTDRSMNLKSARSSLVVSRSSSRQGTTQRNRHTESQSRRTKMQEQIKPDNRMHLCELDNIRYVRYKVDPYIVKRAPSLRRYNKECTYRNWYDFLVKNDSFILK